MKAKNTHTTREGWLLAATDELRPHFADHGFTLPDKIRHALAFTSTGKRGRMAGECWHADLSGDQHFEIYIRPDKDDPLEVLGVLVHELIHYAYIRIMPSWPRERANPLMFQRCCSA